MNIVKYFKKRRLLKKYRSTDEKRRNDVWLLMTMKGDWEFIKFFNHQRQCERRCYQRLKRL